MAYSMAKMILAAAFFPLVAHGASLVKNVNVPGAGSFSTKPGLGQAITDDFALLKDDFDAAAADTILGAAAPLLPEMAALQKAPTEKHFLVKLFLNLMTLAVLLRGAHRYRSEGVDGKPLSSITVARLAAAAPPSKKSLREDIDVVSFNALMQALQGDNDPQRWRALLEGAAPGVALRQDACGCTALHSASQRGCAELVEMLLGRGADPKAKEAWEDTPLHFAARAGSIEVCKLLLASGADIDATNLNGETPTLAAAVAGMEDACELLLEHGGGVSGVADSELPPLLTMLLFRRMFSPVSIASDPSASLQSLRRFCVASQQPQQQQQQQQDNRDWDLGSMDF